MNSNVVIERLRSAAAIKPITTPIAPFQSPCRRTRLEICRRDAPTVLRVANSRVRWAIVIESELAITKLPTKRAIPPNASRKPRRNEMKPFVSDASSYLTGDVMVVDGGYSLEQRRMVG